MTNTSLVTTKKNAVVFIAAGGTGGHVIPASVLAQELAARGYRVHFFTDNRGKNFIPTQPQWRVKVIPLVRYRGKFTTFIKFLVTLVSSIILCIKELIMATDKSNIVKTKTYGRTITKISANWQSIIRLQLLNKSLSFTNPIIIIGFGGYVTLPLLISAILLRLPILLHEQNAVLGIVNRYLGRFAKAIITSTPKVLKAPEQLYSKFIMSGVPVRRIIEDLRNDPSSFVSYQQRYLNILVLGGSQGAEFFSKFIPDTLAILPSWLQKKIRVHQQCCFNDIKMVQQIYEKYRLKFKLVTFFDNIAQELQQADLIIARAGASTIAEVSMVGRAVFFIPYPSAVDDHQTVNAIMATQYGGGWWKSQADCHPIEFSNFLQYIASTPQILSFEAEAVRQYGKTKAVEQLITHIEDLINFKLTSTNS